MLLQPLDGRQLHRQQRYDAINYSDSHGYYSISPCLTGDGLCLIVIDRGQRHPPYRSWLSDRISTPTAL